jgi:hypothetical protein
MSDHNDMLKSMRLVKVATLLLEEAENLNHQPLFYDEEGSPMDVLECLRYTVRCQRDELVREGVLKP